ncbi:MAG: hypothetical protein RSC43_00245 [Clostridia bacterium]
MNLISVHSKNQLLTAIILKQYFYGTTPIDILIWNSFPDAHGLYKRLESSNIFNRAYLIEDWAIELPITLRYKWYREVILGVSAYNKDSMVRTALQETNKYLTVSFFEDSPNIYTATNLSANKVFVFNKAKFLLPISAYELPGVITASILDICNFVFGYMRESALSRYDNIVLAVKHPGRVEEAGVINRYQNMVHPPFVIAVEGALAHRFVGQSINVLLTDYPLPLLYANGDLAGKKLFVYEPLAVENLSLLLAMGVKVCIYLQAGATLNYKHVESLMRIFKDCKNVIFTDSITKLNGIMEEL